MGLKLVLIHEESQRPLAEWNQERLEYVAGDLGFRQTIELGCEVMEEFKKNNSYLTMFPQGNTIGELQ